MLARVGRSFGVVHRANKTMMLVGKVPKEKVLTTNYIAETDEWSKQIQQETADGGDGGGSGGDGDGGGGERRDNGRACR